MVWEINNETHEIEETKFSPKQAKIGNEKFENWLLRLLKPRIDFRFTELNTEKGKEWC